MKPEKQLYQWDVNQYLTGINPAAQYVDYKIGNEVIRIKADGTRCRIPDEVLQTYGGKTCYERYPDGTFRAYSFTVLYAPKPPDYVYTPEERTTFEALTARVDAAIEEIKRRADSGEFTPVKGVDYFTNAEKAEMMDSVSSGAVGEFRKVVDTATTEYNDNASEKLTTYNANAEQHTTDYNRNAAEKLEAYNQNHAAKVEEYNQNAETKTAEFDANAAALQTEVDRLRGECDNLAAENRKQENRIDALIKLNKGQTYDILPEEGEAASRTAPSGAKYVSVDKVGGKSVVWNQLAVVGIEIYSSIGDIAFTNNKDGSYTVNGTALEANSWCFPFDYTKTPHKFVAGHKYLIKGCPSGGSYNTYRLGLTKDCSSVTSDYGNGKLYTALSQDDGQPIGCVIYIYAGTTIDNLVFKPQIFDLTQMFGSGNEPSTVEEFEAMFPAAYYPYSEPTIISSQTDRVDVASADGTITQHITTGFPVLNSAGSVYDYIDLNEGKLHQRVGIKDLGTINWEQGGSNNITSWVPVSWRTNVKPVQDVKLKANILCNKYHNDTALHVEKQVNDKTIAVNKSGWVYIYDSEYVSVTPQEFKTAMSGVMLYYELAEEIITDITIQTELTDWLEVEAGGTVAFRNADESKQLAVPNAVSWVRKLNEVE